MDNTLNTITTHQVTADRALCWKIEIVRLNMCFVRAFVCTVGTSRKCAFVCAGKKKHYLYEVKKVLKV